MIRVLIAFLITIFVTSCGNTGGIKSISQLKPIDSNYNSTLGPSSKVTCNSTTYAKKHTLFYESESEINKVQFFMPDLTYFMTKGDIQKDSLLTHLLSIDDFKAAKIDGDKLTINNEVIKIERCNNNSNELLFTYKNELYCLELN